MTDFVIIVVDRATEAELNACHAIVKKNSKSWWHRHVNMWIAGGKNGPAEWRDMFEPALIEPDSSVLILTLPPSADREWAFLGFGADEKTSWIERCFKSYESESKS